MSLTLPTLLERGYFPQELPPPFTSQGLAGFGKAPLPFTTTPRTSRPEIFNLARTGTLRRQLSILTPASGDFVAADANFSKLKAAGVAFYDASKIALSPPPVPKPKIELLGDYESEDSDETDDKIESYF